MAQGAGYLLAAAGPFVLGALHDATGGWTAPMLLLAALCVPMGIAGVGGPGPPTRRRAHGEHPHPRSTRPLRPPTPYQGVCSCDSGCSYDVRQCVRASARRKG
ncbi:hypothetical protein ACFCWG_03040 [Streptomyces sp. NPDC056390]|uniref:hypothetical protein n=1 Tax=Streptomyces sp. NPDC056390 TaxID=3345806 RepID=UPI0035D6A4EB